MWLSGQEGDGKQLAQQLPKVTQGPGKGYRHVLVLDDLVLLFVIDILDVEGVKHVLLNVGRHGGLCCVEYSQALCAVKR